MVLLLYTIVAVKSKGSKEKKKPHSGEVDTKSYPQRKLQRIENNNGGITDSQFEKGQVMEGDCYTFLVCQVY